MENFKVYSKNNNNFLWVVYKDGSEVGIELDKIDDNFMKDKFNENYFLEPDENNLEDDKEEEKIRNQYSFIDLTGKDEDYEIPEIDYEILKKYKERSNGDWEIISAESEDEA